MKFKNRPGEATRIAESYKPLTHIPLYVQWWYIKKSYVRILLPSLVNLRAILYFYVTTGCCFDEIYGEKAFPGYYYTA